MKLLTKLLEAPIDAFKNKDFVFHYFKPANIQAPYAVWIDQGEESFWADNGKGERSLSGTLDFYTQTTASLMSLRKPCRAWVHPGIYPQFNLKKILC